MKEKVNVYLCKYVSISGAWIYDKDGRNPVLKENEYYSIHYKLIKETGGFFEYLWLDEKFNPDEINKKHELKKRDIGRTLCIPVSRINFIHVDKIFYEKRD